MRFSNPRLVLSALEFVQRDEPLFSEIDIEALRVCVNELCGAGLAESVAVPRGASVVRRVRLTERGAARIREAHAAAHEAAVGVASAPC